MLDLSRMLIPKKDRVAIYEHLFKEGVMVAKKDYSPRMKHPEVAVMNLYVLKALTVSMYYMQVYMCCPNCYKGLCDLVVIPPWMPSCARLNMCNELMIYACVHDQPVSVEVFCHMRTWPKWPAVSLKWSSYILHTSVNASSNEFDSVNNVRT